MIRLIMFWPTVNTAVTKHNIIHVGYSIVLAIFNNYPAKSRRISSDT